MRMCNAQGRLWVKLRSLNAQLGSPLCAQEQTSSAGPVRSEKCQEPTWVVKGDGAMQEGIRKRRHEAGAGPPKERRVIAITDDVWYLDY